MRMLIFLLLFSSGAISAECDIELATLLERYVAARGGHEALEKQHALRIRSDYHEGKWNPTFDYRVMKPGYMWIRATYDDGFVYTEGFDGERGWEQPGADRPAEYVGGDAARALNQGAQSPVHLYGLHHMSEMGAKVTFSGCDSIEGTYYFVVNVVSVFGTDIDYFLNAETYLMERGRSVRPLHPTADPTPITIEERWADFRDVAGVLHPFDNSNWNVDSGERLSWLEIHTIEPFTDATVEFFAKPGQ